MGNLEDFLAANNINKEAWGKADIGWDALQKIAQDYKVFSESLVDTASFQASLIQKIESVHSVRWRVKDTSHLLEKIIRKRAEGKAQGEPSKYDDISVENYHEKVTDLVGIRALHLFKDDCFSIHDGLLQLWDPSEAVVAYIRNGDSSELNARYKEQEMKVKNHPAGYRSIHYIFESKALKRPVISEVQVRSIFEEAWSEIDHTIRYPNFSDNELVGYFLDIFNRLAGNADEMGSFVKDLAKSLQVNDIALQAMADEKDLIFKKMESALIELSKERQKSEKFEESIEELKEDLKRLKRQVPIVRNPLMRSPLLDQATRNFDLTRGARPPGISSRSAALQRASEIAALATINKKD